MMCVSGTIQVHMMCVSGTVQVCMMCLRHCTGVHDVCLRHCTGVHDVCLRHCTGVHDVCLRPFTLLHIKEVRKPLSTSIFEFLEHKQWKLHPYCWSTAMEIGRISPVETGSQ